MEELPVEGDVVAEKYRVEGLLGEGSMGRVYRARHLLLGQDVAIKLLRASVDSEELRTRFVREAKATMALRGEHIVRVYDLGVLPSNTPYMVLEYLEGTDLRSELVTRGALPVAEAVDYVLQACEALAEAHLSGIVHRDLKPQNLFLTKGLNGAPCVKLLDFGVSKFEVRLDSSDELTMSHVLLGSPVFMSPEQIRDSRKVDARADLWSLGVVLYMLVGGGRPFEGEGLGGTCASIMVDPPRPLAARCPDVPPALEAVVLRCLEKSRDRRMPDVGELARCLEPFASPAGRASIERVAQLFASAPPAPSPTSTRSPSVPPPSPRSMRALPPPNERTEADAVIPAHAPAVAMPSSRTPPTPRAGGRAVRAAVGLSIVLALLLAGGLGWRRAHAPRSAAAASIAAAAPPPATSEPPPSEATEAPPKSEDTSVDTSAAPAALPVARSAATPAPRRAGDARGSRPGAGGMKRKGQVDRNGVPILE